MSHKIIFPEGIELIEYLNRGYAICIANCHASYLTTNKAEEKS